jgi:DNA invertase Pin-like site-specific DNA recombinase
MPESAKVKRKVAGYARVSTEYEEQQTSYEAQIEYYTNYIRNRDNWEFVKVYTDEGISATSTAHRDGFNAMIEDALSGKIDLIITKSVSRFARNTVDSLTTIRKLKERGIECYFEKENIWTFDGKGELLLTIMSSLAQEESRSISENVTWGQRKRFADGKVSLPYSRFLGYKKGADGLPEIVPEEAEIIRFIYKTFMEGKTPYAIAKILTEKGILTASGKKKWHQTTVESILTNEKYKGAALLQKRFTVDFLTKKTVINEGQVPQYYIEHSHEPIIPPDEFEEVQAELAKRKKLGRKYSGNTIFSAKLICGDCGSYFGAKVWHSTSKYRRVIWQCNHKFKSEKFCTTPHLYEDEIKQRFLKAFSEFFERRDEMLAVCKRMIQELSDTSTIDEKIEAAGTEMNKIAGQIREHIRRNAMTEENDDAQYQALTEQFRKAEEKQKRLRKLQDEQINRTDAMNVFLKKIESTEEITTFDDDLWRVSVESVTVYGDGRMVFRFLDGREITA